MSKWGPNTSRTLLLAAARLAPAARAPRFDAFYDLRVLVASIFSELNSVQTYVVLSENVVVTQTRVRIPLGPPLKTSLKLSLLLRFHAHFARRSLTTSDWTETDRNGHKRTAPWHRDGTGNCDCQL